MFALSEIVHAEDVVKDEQYVTIAATPFYVGK
jgi:hypothetical protein